MIKICFVTTISLTLKSFVLQVAKSLHDAGDFEITMICNPDDAFSKTIPSYINFIPVKMKRGFGFDGIRVIKQLKKIFKTNSYDIVQYSTPNASFYSAVASKKAKIPIRLYCQWGIAYTGFRGIKRSLLKILEKHTCKCSTWIEPDSKSNLSFSHSEKLYPKTIGSVIWNGSACGVDLTKFNYQKKEEYRAHVRAQYNIAQDTFVFGFVGRITKDKGIDELLQSFRNVISENHDAFLMLVGSIDKENTINPLLLQWARNEPRVLFCGFSNVIEQYLSAMDTYVLPSYREGFGLGVVEAEAMGVPVIVSNIPGPIDAMENNKTGLLVEKKNVSQLTKAMLHLINSKELCETLGNNGVIFAKNNFDQKQFVEKMIEDRKELVNKNYGNHKA